MKKIIWLQILFSVLILGGCQKGSEKDDSTPTCTEQKGTELTSINVFDGNIASPYYGVAIGNFKFNQVVNTYSNNCKATNYGATSLTITNTTNRILSISYIVVASIGVVTWQYQDVATIAPNATVDVGEINTNVQRLHAGRVVIQLNNISYR